MEPTLVDAINQAAVSVDGAMVNVAVKQVALSQAEAEATAAQTDLDSRKAVLVAAIANLETAIAAIKAKYGL